MVKRQSLMSKEKIHHCPVGCVLCNHPTDYPSPIRTVRAACLPIHKAHIKQVEPYSFFDRWLAACRIGEQKHLHTSGTSLVFRTQYLSVYTGYARLYDRMVEIFQPYRAGRQRRIEQSGRGKQAFA